MYRLQSVDRLENKEIYMLDSSLHFRTDYKHSETMSLTIFNKKLLQALLTVTTNKLPRLLRPLSLKPIHLQLNCNNAEMNLIQQKAKIRN